MYLEEKVKLLEVEVDKIRSSIIKDNQQIDFPVWSLQELQKRKIMSRAKAYQLEKSGELELIRRHGRTFVSNDELCRYFGEELNHE